jgi:hypothetical protein
VFSFGKFIFPCVLWKKAINRSLKLIRSRRNTVGRYSWQCPARRKTLWGAIASADIVR